jgi:hypothetical protein
MPHAPYHDRDDHERGRRDGTRVVVAGGHSAGHIEPAMNFADALLPLEPTAEITALGTVRGLDTMLIPARGYPLELIPPVPLARELNGPPTPWRRIYAREDRAAGAAQIIQDLYANMPPTSARAARWRHGGERVGPRSRPASRQSRTARLRHAGREF